MNRNRFSLIAVLFFSFLFLLSPMVASAEDLYVPDQYKTIQEAVNGAAPFDTIIVRDGVYTGEGNSGIKIWGDLTLFVRSEKGPAGCIIDCGGASSGFNFYGNENSIIQGFTIINANAGIQAVESGPRILDCVIRDNTEAGISATFQSAPYIQNCVLSNNKGNGIYLVGSDVGTMISNCTVTANAGSGVSCFYSCNGTIQDCRIESNQGSGVMVQNDHQPRRVL